MTTPLHKRKFGWKPSLPKKANLYSAHREMLNQPPMNPVVDLSSGCSPIEDQGQHGTCVGHGTCGMLEFLETAELKAKQVGPEVFDSLFHNLSRLFVYSNARLIDGTPLSEDNGTTITSAITGIKNSGICEEDLWPYLDDLVTAVPGTNAYAQATLHKVIWDFKLDNTNLQQLKQCLAWGYPVIFGITCFDSMMTKAVAATGYVPLPGVWDNPVGGHCMLLVGYNDELQKFKIRNSWGTSWGVEGYGTIDYAYLTSSELASDFWTLRKTSSIT